MAHTAAREHFGGSVRMSLAADLHVGLFRGPGCVRLFHLHTSTPGLTVHLPVTGLVAGGEPLLTVINDPDDGVEDIAVGPDITLAPGEMVHCFRTASGWLYDRRAVEVGSPLTIGRVPFRFDIRGATTYWSLRTNLQQAGWDGITPVAAEVTIHENSIVGATGPSPAFTAPSGGMPSGSTLLLRIRPTGYISGRGGAGGRGGDTGTGLLAQNGSAGGTGLYTRIPTVILSEGTIQGGGGGGGGGASASGQGGGGGGGGAGYTSAQGGLGGTPGGQRGFASATNLGGPGGGAGARRGGDGGAPGTAGASGGAAGGAAGLAIDGYSYCTFIRAGTILGATAG